MTEFALKLVLAVEARVAPCGKGRQWSNRPRGTLFAGVLAAALVLGGVRLGAQSAHPPPEAVSHRDDATAGSARQETAEAEDEETSVPRYERIRFSGDFRSRYEGFYQEGRQTRNRFRLRLRLRADAEVNEDVTFHLQVASGDPGTPVSTNQTFTSFFRPKPFNLDVAYVEYNPQAFSAVTLAMGKFTFPQMRTQMVFDDDLHFEGGWEQVSWDATDAIGVTLGALQTAVNETGSAGDSFMVGGHGEVSFDVAEHRLRVSAANYAWGNADQIAVGQAAGPLRSILTNAVNRDLDGDVTGFASRFNVVDVIAEATLQTSRPAYPLRFLVDVAQNTRAASDLDSGFWVEAEYGRPRRARTWGAAYTYGWVEQDVTPSAFVFSDMPGTNVRLHMIEASYVPKEGLSLDANLHLTKRLRASDGQPNTWLSRLHVAVVVRF